MNEPLLFGAYARTFRVEVCACGGSIAAEHGEDEAIRLAVQEHNDGEMHQAWRCWQQLRLSGERPTALVDVSRRASAPPLIGGAA